MIHFDTSFLVRAVIDGSPQGDMWRRWILEGTGVAISAVALCEFLCGSAGADVGQEALVEILGPGVPITAEEAEVAARLFNETGRRRNSLNDCLIAATALTHGASLATCDAAHFRRFARAGLRLAAANAA